MSVCVQVYAVRIRYPLMLIAVPRLCVAVRVLFGVRTWYKRAAAAQVYVSTIYEKDPECVHAGDNISS